MYLRKLTLKNIRGFRELDLTFPDAGKTGNWCMILGENGVGKSTILRSIALAFVSDRSAARLLPNPGAWLAYNAESGTCEAVLSGQRFLPKSYTVGYELTQQRDGAERMEGALVHREPYTQEFEAESDVSVVAGYGPFRRPEGVRSDRVATREEAFRTLFDDSAAILALEGWLQRLDYATKDTEAVSEAKRQQYHSLLMAVKEIIDSLWPDDNKVHLKVSVNGVRFVGTGGVELSLSDLSDGYRTMFTLTCDLLRHAARAVDADLSQAISKRTLLNVSGIVLIDEVDAHLHPKWQREIGFHLQRTFPRIQFIVATHSPFVAQAASPGGIIVLDRNPETGEVYSDTSLTSLRGVPAEDILQSRAFDLEMTQDVVTEAKLQRHARLAAKRQRGLLSDSGLKELARLETELKHLLRDENDHEDDVLLRLEKLLQEAPRKHD